MKTLLLPSRALLVLVALALIASLHAQSNAARTPPPLGLLRLKSEARTGEAAPVAVAKYSVDDLATIGVTGASKSKRNNADYLALGAGVEWSRPLRGSARDVTFISFQLYVSAGTIIDIGGARIGFTASPVDDSLQVMFDDSSAGTLQWKSLSLHLDTAGFDGKNLAMVPTLTVRLDPATETWDVFSGSRLLADNLPLIASRKNEREFRLRAGAQGVWVTGLVMADENPLYEDANANGIDDRFEKEKRGALLSPQAGVAERKLLAQEWKQAQGKKAPALHVNRPMPDAP